MTRGRRGPLQSEWAMGSHSVWFRAVERGSGSRPPSGRSAGLCGAGWRGRRVGAAGGGMGGGQGLNRCCRGGSFSVFAGVNPPQDTFPSISRQSGRGGGGHGDWVPPTCDPDGDPACRPPTGLAPQSRASLSAPVRDQMKSKLPQLSTGLRRPRSAPLDRAGPGGPGLPLGASALSSGPMTARGDQIFLLRP